MSSTDTMEPSTSLNSSSSEHEEKKKEPAPTSNEEEVPASTKEEEEEVTETATTTDTNSESTDEPITAVDDDDAKPSLEEAKATHDDSSSDSDSDSEDSLPPIRRIRSSIKLKTLHQDIPISLGRKSFRTLPPPDMDKVRKAATLPAYMSPEDVFRIMSGVNHEEDSRSDLSVKFNTVRIREYEQTIGDNPSVSYGPPIALDWNYEEQNAIDVDDYETQRQSRRRPFQKLGLNYYQRKALLLGKDHSEEDLKKAKKQANKDKFQRAVTKYFLPVRFVEDAAESVTRKVKRSFQRRNSTLT